MRGAGSSTSSSGTGRSSSADAEAEMLASPPRPPPAPRRATAARPRSPSPSGCAARGVMRASRSWRGRARAPHDVQHGPHSGLCSPAARGRPSGSRPPGARRSSSPTPPDTAAADAAIAALRERGSPSHDGLAARLADFRAARRPGARAAAGALVAAAGRQRRDAQRLGAVRRARRRGPLARGAPRGVARVLGRAAGRSAPAGAVEVGEQPVDAMTRELEEEWSVAPARLSVEALAGAERAGLPRRARVAAGGRRGRAATTSTTRTPGGRPTSSDWPDEADETVRRMAGAARMSAAAPLRRSPLLRTLSFVALGDLRGAARLLAGARPAGPTTGARLGTRAAVDRHVAALHRRRAAADDPVLARRRGRRGRRPRPLRGHDRFRRGGAPARAACGRAV